MLVHVLEGYARSYLSPKIAQNTRLLISYGRFAIQLMRGRMGYRKYSGSYSNPLLFIAGLPKSGTTWLRKMLASYPGYTDVMIPRAVAYELEHAGSHDFDLSEEVLKRLDDILGVLKLHSHGSKQNVQLLARANVPYVILYRDLRDVAVSHYFYVRRTPWHPEHSHYRQLNVEEGLLHFGRSLLPKFVNWVRLWRENRDPERSLVVRYEDLLQDTEQVFTRIAAHYDLVHSPHTIRPIVEAHSFENMSGGRTRGEQEDFSFFRKGVAGDWQNHFSEKIKCLFKEQGDGFWVEQGYEDNTNW